MSHNPHYATPSGLHTAGLGYSRFARRYSGSRICFPFLQVTEMFQFTWFPLSALFFQAEVTRNYACWVSPFRHPRIEA